MKKIISTTLLVTAVLSSFQSCTTYPEYMGTMTGAEIGGMVGHSIGRGTHSYNGGWLGTLIGTVAGAAIGYSVGNAATQSERPPKSKKVKKSKKSSQRSDDEYNRRGSYDDTYGYQTDGGYDEGASEDIQAIEDDGSAVYTVASNNSDLVITKQSYMDSNGDGFINKGELITVMFDVKNSSSHEINNLRLDVVENDNGKCFVISPAKVVNIRSGETLRYSAKVMCKRIPSTSKAEFTLLAVSPTATANSEMRIKLK